MAISDRILSVESGGDPNARNPRSSAYGAGQFIESTWIDTLAKHRPDLITGKSREELLTLRADPALSKEMTAAYASDNGAALTAAGLPVTPGTAYLAHFAGPKGAVGVLNADPAAPVGSVLGEGAVRANPFLKNMTVGDLRAWADRKMGSEPVKPAGSPPVGVQVQASPVQPTTVPIAMGGAPTGPVGSSSFGSMAPQEPMQLMAPVPIKLPPRRPFDDTSRLFAAMQARPLSRGLS